MKVPDNARGVMEAVCQLSYPVFSKGHRPPSTFDLQQLQLWDLWSKLSGTESSASLSLDNEPNVTGHLHGTGRGLMLLLEYQTEVVYVNLD